jgi:hypothetical protein
MKKNYLILLISLLSNYTFSQQIIVVNLNNGIVDGSLFQINANVNIGDVIRFTNNLPYSLTNGAGVSTFIDADPGGNVGPFMIPAGQFHQITINNQTVNSYTFMHFNPTVNPMRSFNVRLNLTYSLGLNNINQVSNLIVYPNPVTTFLNIKQDLLNNVSYKIASITGQVVQTGEVNNSEKQINVSSLSDGIYFLQIFDNNKSLGQEKFVKNSK